MSRNGSEPEGTDAATDVGQRAATERVRPVRAILFDKDGTLFDFRLTWIPIMREAALRLAAGDQALADRLLIAAGYDPHADRFSSDGPIAAGTSDDIAAAWMRLMPNDRFPHGLRPDGSGEPQPQPLREILDRDSLTLGPQASVPVCDLPRLLQTLRGAGLRLGLATSDTESAAKATLQRFEILDCFDWISGYDSGMGRKPSAAIVDRFAQRVATDSHSVLVVGDTLHDLNMARAAGAMSAAVLTGAVEREALAPYADVVLESIADLPQLLGIGSGLAPALRSAPCGR